MKKLTMEKKVDSGQIKSFKEHCKNFFYFCLDQNNSDLKNLDNFITLMTFSTSDKNFKRNCASFFLILKKTEKSYIEKLSDESKQRMIPIFQKFDSITESILRRVVSVSLSFALNKENSIESRSSNVENIINIVDILNSNFDFSKKFEILIENGNERVSDYTKKFDLIPESFLLFSKTYPVMKEISLQLFNSISSLRIANENFINRIYKLNDQTSSLEQLGSENASYLIIKNSIDANKSVSMETLGNIIKSYFFFKSELLFEICEYPNSSLEIISNFKKNYNLSWYEIDKILEFSGSKGSKIGLALIQIAKKKAALQKGLITQIIIEYCEDYSNFGVSSQEIMICEDQWKNNILHCLANSITEKMSLSAEDWDVYNEIVDDSNILDINLDKKRNQLGKTPEDILISSNLSVGVETISLEN